MKKLMVVAIAVASCTAFAKSEVPLEKGVYSITLTQKDLDYTTKTITLKNQDKVESHDAAIEAARAAYCDETEKLLKAAPDFDFADFDENQVVSRKSGQLYTWTYKFTGPSVNTKDIAATKVVTTTLNGLYVTGYDDLDGAYIWDKKVTGNYTNTLVKADTTTSKTEKYDTEDEANVRAEGLKELVGSNVDDVLEGSIAVKNSGSKWQVTYKKITKKNSVKLPEAYAEDFAVVDSSFVTGDGKAAAGFTWDNDLQGWGTGTANKEDGVYTTIKTVAGNTVALGLQSYGTWKFQLDTTATKAANKDGATIESVLASKKVELVK